MSACLAWVSSVSDLVNVDMDMDMTVSSDFPVRRRCVVQTSYPSLTILPIAHTTHLDMNLSSKHKTDGDLFASTESNPCQVLFLNRLLQDNHRSISRCPSIIVVIRVTPGTLGDEVSHRPLVFPLSDFFVLIYHVQRRKLESTSSP